MKKLNIKHIIPFIIFILLCMLLYANFGVISVNAATFPDGEIYGMWGSNTDYLNFHYQHYKSSILMPDDIYLRQLSFRIESENPIVVDTSQPYLYVQVFYHSTYYYDITNPEYFSFTKAFSGNNYFLDPNHTVNHGTQVRPSVSIKTSYDNNGVVVYNEFFTYTYIFDTTSPDFHFDSWDTNVLLVNSGLVDNLLKIPDTVERGSFEILDIDYSYSFTDKDYINHISDYDDTTYYEPEDLPYSIDSESDAFALVLSGLFKQKMGILYFPIDLITTVLGTFMSLPNTSGEINIPTIKDPIFNQTLITERTFNLNSVFQHSGFVGMYEIYLLVVDVIIIFAFLHFCYKKFNSIFGR